MSNILLIKKKLAVCPTPQPLHPDTLWCPSSQRSGSTMMACCISACMKVRSSYCHIVIGGCRHWLDVVHGFQDTLIHVVVLLSHLAVCSEVMLHDVVITLSSSRHPALSSTQVPPPRTPMVMAVNPSTSNSYATSYLKVVVNWVDWYDLPKPIPVQCFFRNTLL